MATGRNLVDENGFWSQDTFKGERSATEVFKGLMFALPTGMIRKVAYDKVCGNSSYPGIRRKEYTDFWCEKYCAGFKGCIASEILFCYFESRNSMTRHIFKNRFA